MFIGGTGNISSDCAAELQRAGHEVAVISRGQNAVPSEVLALKADRKDPVAMSESLRRFDPDVLLNFLGYELADVQLDYEVAHGKVRQYVFISSATVYAKPPQRIPITEDAPLGNAYWEYAQKKLACEQWLLERAHADGFPVTVVRPSHTYSNRWVPNPVASSSYTFCRRLEQGKTVFVPDNGENPWTLTAASDFAVALAGLVGNAAAVGEVFHITSDEVLSWNEIVEEIAVALGARQPRVVKVPTEFICRMAPAMSGSLTGDKSHPGVFDNSKIKRLVPGFACRKPFRVGVRGSIAWLRAHPEQQNLKPAVDELCDRVVEAWRAENTQAT